MEWYYIALIAAFVLCVLVAFLMFRLGAKKQKKEFEEKVGSAEQKGREIIDNALKTVEGLRQAVASAEGRLAEWDQAHGEDIPDA